MSELDERWAPIPGAPGYEASDQGHIRSVDRVIALRDGRNQLCRGVMLHPWASDDGRRWVTVSGRRKHRVHQLVLEAFVGPCPLGKEGCHRNDDQSDNRLANLYWGTKSENAHDRVRNGGHPATSRAQCPHGHLLLHPNLVPWQWEKRGARACLACSRARANVARDPTRDLQTYADIHYAAILTGESLVRSSTDGHHRAAAAIARGETHVTVRVKRGKR